MKRKIRLMICLLLLFLLIIDNDTMQHAVQDGIELCLQTLIPSLFPFMVLTCLLTHDMYELSFPGARRIERLLKIPKGCLSIFLLGLLGGYPVGAKCICQAVEKKSLSVKEAKRMLCFCSNAGPSFIFGFGLSLFSNLNLCWQIWLCQILSAVLLAMMMPANSGNAGIDTTNKAITISHALRSGFDSLKTVCGWVILFRVLIVYSDKLLLKAFPKISKTVIYGILEMTNGCISLKNIPHEGERFILFSMLLAFGGLCVYMQIKSISENVSVDSEWYPAAKLLQSLLAGTLAFLCYEFGSIVLPAVIFIITLIYVICSYLLKNTTGNLLYHDV